MIVNIGKVRVNYTGEYSPDITYNFYDNVFYNNNSYICTSSTGAPKGTLPSEVTYWTQVTSQAAQIASIMETREGTSHTKIVTPLGLNSVLVSGAEKINHLGAVEGTQTLSCEQSSIYTMTISGDLTLNLLPAIQQDWVRVMTFIIKNGGASIITWPLATSWPKGTAPLLSVNGIDIINLFGVYDNTNQAWEWYGSLAGSDFK